MRRRWHNLVGRGLVLVLLALFALPCVACEDSAGGWMRHGSHDAAPSALRATPCPDVFTCEQPLQEAPPCACLSDATKVMSDQSVAIPIMPETDLPPVLAALPLPPVVRVSGVEPVLPRPPLLVHPAVADRALPAS